jgi:hypothetical protein
MRLCLGNAGRAAPAHPILSILSVFSVFSVFLVAHHHGPRYLRSDVATRQPATGAAKTRARVPQKEKVSDLKSDTFSRLWTLQRPSERSAGHSCSVASQGLHPGTRVQM